MTFTSFSFFVMSPAKRAGLGLALTGVLSLSACGAGNVNLDPAPDAANPVCAYAMVAMPEKLVGLQQRETTAQGTTAWGEPASVILKCGVTVQEPVSDPCAEVNGIDWVLRPKDAPENSAPPVSASSSAAAGPENRATGTWTATTYGRTPAIEVTFDADKVSSSTLLTELNSAVKQIPSQKKCTNINDTLNGVKTGK
ncbi:MAG: DUF3515 domain-containing protein [Rothia dentocariosa]